MQNLHFLSLLSIGRQDSGYKYIVFLLHVSMCACKEERGSVFQFCIQPHTSEKPKLPLTAVLVNNDQWKPSHPGGLFRLCVSRDFVLEEEVSKRIIVSFACILYIRCLRWLVEIIIAFGLPAIVSRVHVYQLCIPRRLV